MISTPWCRIFIMLFFLIFFAQNAHFFLIVGHRFFICKMWNKMFGETKKSFIILWFYFCFDSFLFFTILEVKKTCFRILLWLFWIFFSFFFVFYFVVWGDFVFWGIFCVVGGRKFFLSYISRFLTIFRFFCTFFFLYIGIFFLWALLENNPRKKSCFWSSFLSYFRPGYLGLFSLFFV